MTGRGLERASLLATLALPVAILFTRAGTEILIGVIDVLALLVWRRDGLRDWRRVVPLPLAALGLTWWASIVLASALRLPADGPHPLLEALAQARFGLLVLALGTTVLATAAARRQVALAIASAAAWIVIECWQQYLLGHDLFGWRRWPDGALTGPFREPRAGPELLLVLFPALLPPVAALLARRRPASLFAASALAAVALGTAVLIGQRMPALLALLGVAIAAALHRPLRPALGAAVGVAIVLLALTPVISPPTFGKLVLRFGAQMSHFRASDYGLIFARATAMTAAHPWVGLGFDGFRHGCADPRYMHAIPWLGVSDRLAHAPAGCNIHPHNHYLEAATASGLPGLALFVGAAVAALGAVGRRLGRAAAPAVAGRRVGWVTALAVALFPFASASAFFTLPLAGWFFLLLGCGLADAADPER